VPPGKPGCPISGRVADAERVPVSQLPPDRMDKKKPELSKLASKFGLVCR
jgi:hypothetical protein